MTQYSAGRCTHAWESHGQSSEGGDEEEGEAHGDEFGVRWMEECEGLEVRVVW